MKSVNRYLIALVDQLNNCVETIFFVKHQKLHHNLLIRRLPL